VLKLVQIAKLSMIPVSCLFEVVFDKIGYSRDTKLSIMVVLAGVAICTVSDVSVNTKGFIAAVVAVWSTAMQQYYVHNLQKKYSLSSFDLLGHTAPVQAASLIVLGPLVDYWLSGLRVDLFDYSLPSVVSCCHLFSHLNILLLSYAMQLMLFFPGFITSRLLRNDGQVCSGFACGLG
jgi:hypothetical protein